MTDPTSSNRAVAWRLLWVLSFAAAIGLIVASLSGCTAGADTKNQNDNVSGPECTEDADCVLFDEVCSPHQVCLPRAKQGLPIAIELDAADDSDPSRRLAQYEIPPLDLDVDTDGIAQITYPGAVQLRGAVMVVNSVEIPLQATLTATRESRIPGRPRVIISKSVMAEGFLMRPNPDDVDPSVALMLPPNVPLTLRTTPDAPYDQSYHPLMKDVTLEADDEQWFMFGDPEQSIHVSGAVLDALGDPVVGARVKAVDEEQGLFVSSSGTTDETGTYHLLMPKGVRQYRLSVGPSGDNASVPQISQHELLIGVLAEQQGTENAYDNPELLAPIHLPAFPDPVPFTFKLEGRGSNGQINPAVGVTVTFVTEVGADSGVHGVYQVTATSDDSGEVQVDLIPGDNTQNRAYQVTLITPVDVSTPEGVDVEAEFASDVLEGDRAVKVGAVGGFMTIELTRRVPFSSFVDSMGYGPISGLTVQARRTDGPESLRGTLRTDLTDDTGHFSLKLAPGQYNIEIIPPTGLPLPRWVLQDPLEVLPDEVPSAFVDGIPLPDAAVLEVLVLSDDGTPSARKNVRVTVYLVDDFCATLNSVDYHTCDVDSVFLGEAVTDANGRARILVPDQE